MIRYSSLLVIIIVLFNIVNVYAQQQQSLATRVAKVIQTTNGNSDYVKTQSNYFIQLRAYLYDQGCTNRLAQKYAIDYARTPGVAERAFLPRLQFVVKLIPTIERNLKEWAGFVTTFDLAVTNALKARTG